MTEMKPDKTIEELMKKVIKEILEHIPGTQAIVLFGSYATGEVKEESDIDLLVLTSHMDEGEFEVCHQPLDGYTLEINMMTSSTFQEEAAQGHPFALAVLRYGIILHDDGTFTNLNKYKGERPGRKFIESSLHTAKERLASNELRSAIICALNALFLLEDKVNISYKLDRILDRGEIKEVNSEVVLAIIEKVERGLGGEAIS